jgi:choline dehydrogenase
MPGSPLDWNFTSTEPYLNNRQIILNRGKALGGTSAINGMTYGRGSASMWDHTAALGNPGWTWADNQEAFKKVISARLVVWHASEYWWMSMRRHSYSLHPQTTARTGTTIRLFIPPPPAQVSHWWSHNPVSPSTLSSLGAGKIGFNNYNLDVEDAFIRAGKAINVNPTVDINGGNQTGAQHEMSTFDSVTQLRVSSYDSFYHTAKNRSNFHVITYAMGEKVLFSNQTGQPTASGVSYTQYDQSGTKRHYNVTVVKEVILSAGVFQSPQLLMLSVSYSAQSLQTTPGACW